MTRERLQLKVDRVGDARANGPTLVLLPAAATTGEDFVTQGFLDDLAAHGVGATVVRCEVPLDLYAADAIVALLADAALPAAGAVYMIGCSLGGMTALACAEAHRGRLAGVYAIAPWPGLRPAWSAIAEEGGVATWAARVRDEPFTDERRVWRWLGQGAPGAAVTVGLARADRFIEGQRALAAALPDARVLWVDGAHDWAAWRALWRAWLAREAPGWAAAGVRR